MVPNVFFIVPQRLLVNNANRKISKSKKSEPLVMVAASKLTSSVLRPQWPQKGPSKHFENSLYILKTHPYSNCTNMEEICWSKLHVDMNNIAPL